MLKLLKYLFFLLVSIKSFSQSTDWKKDLIEMNKVYYEAASFKMEVGVYSYARIIDLKPISTYKGKVAHSGANYYSSMIGRITLQNKRCVLVVDNPQKMILYRKNNTEKTNSSKGGFSLANLDSAMILMGKNVKVEYLVNTKQEKRIQLIYKEGKISKIEISINPENNTMMELVYYYNTTEDYSNSVAKVIIKYSNVELNKTISESTFSENNFISVKKDKIVALKEYQKYQVVNQSEALKQ